MAFPTFDTHRAVKALTEAGFEEAQAETLVDTMSEAIGGNVATRADLETLELRLGGRMETLELRLIIRIGGIVIASAGLVIALLKFLP
jgi:hypothetical protein